MVNIVAADPAVDAVNGFTGGGRGGSTNTGSMFIALKPLAERKISADLVIARLRPKLGRIPGATLYLQANQDIRVGGRNSAAQYQYTMRGDNLDDLNRVRAAHVPGNSQNPDHRRRQQRPTEPRSAIAGDLRRAPRRVSAFRRS